MIRNFDRLGARGWGAVATVPLPEHINNVVHLIKTNEATPKLIMLIMQAYSKNCQSSLAQQPPFNTLEIIKVFMSSKFLLAIVNSYS